MKGGKRTRASGTAVRRTGRATTRSTAGPGFTFEDQIAAWLLLKMLTGEAMPGMDGRLGVQLQSQTSALGWFIDDLLVTCGRNPKSPTGCLVQEQSTGDERPAFLMTSSAPHGSSSHMAEQDLCAQIATALPW